MTWDILPPGVWLIFGIIMLPVYTVILGWFLGSPRNPKKAMMALSYLIGLTFMLWGGMFALTIIIGLVFF